jgi:hypothetical protein
MMELKSFGTAPMPISAQLTEIILWKARCDSVSAARKSLRISLDLYQNLIISGSTQPRLM